jgi:ABC-type amino acid transport system permease subunit
MQITMLQATLFASLISVDEIFRVAQQVNSLVYKPVEIYSMLAVLFIAICAPLHLLANFLKNKFTRNLSER